MHIKNKYDICRYNNIVENNAIYAKKIKTPILHFTMNTSSL